VADLREQADMAKTAPWRVRQQYVLTERDARRFWGKVSKDGPEHPELGHCWTWQASQMASGYSQFHVKLTSGRWSSTVAHRIAYELAVGPIPGEMVLDHLCRNRACVNPAHLELVTDLVNILRGNGWSGRNARKTHCPRGHEYNEKNTYLGKRQMRQCRACDAEKHREAREQGETPTPQ
jgi:hypothetical protein